MKLSHHQNWSFSFFFFFMLLLLWENNHGKKKEKEGEEEGEGGPTGNHRSSCRSRHQLHPQKTTFLVQTGEKEREKERVQKKNPRRFLPSQKKPFSRVSNEKLFLIKILFVNSLTTTKALLLLIRDYQLRIGLRVLIDNIFLIFIDICNNGIQ